MTKNNSEQRIDQDTLLGIFGRDLRGLEDLLKSYPDCPLRRTQNGFDADHSALKAWMKRHPEIPAHTDMHYRRGGHAI